MLTSHASTPPATEQRAARRCALALAAACFALVLPACGGDPGPPDTGPEVPPDSCGQIGDEGNDIGVGRFCTRRGGECSVNTGARLCLQDVSPEDGQWFCTRLCTMDSECGTGALCVGESRGAGCVPMECAPPPVDSGTAPDGSAGGDSDAGGSDAGDPGMVDAG